MLEEVVEVAFKKKEKKVVTAYDKESIDKTIDVIRSVMKDPTCIFKMSEFPVTVDFRSTGSFVLDYAAGGGYPKGRLVSSQGGENSGKSTTALLSIAAAQRAGEKPCVWIDAEHTFDPAWATVLGVNVDDLYLVQPDMPAEKVWSLMYMLLKSCHFSIIVLDSLDALVSAAEMAGEEDTMSATDQVSGLAKLNTKAMRLIIGSKVLATSETTVIVIQQLRDKIGGYNPSGTPQTTTTGGRSLKHNYSQIMKFRKGEIQMKGTDPVGQEIIIKIDKNKVGSPYKTACLMLGYGTGIDLIDELFKIGKTLGIIINRGPYYSLVDPGTGELLTDHDGTPLKWQGEVKFKAMMIEDAEKNEGVVTYWIYDRVEEFIKGGTKTPVSQEPEEEVGEPDELSDEEARTIEAAAKKKGSGGRSRKSKGPVDAPPKSE